VAVARTLPPPKRRLWRRAAQGLGWLLVFVLSALVGLIVHANVPALRSALSSSLNRSLSGNVRGRLEVQAVEHIGLTRAVVRSIEVFDEQGRLVLNLEGVSLRYRPLSLLHSLISEQNDPLRVEHVRVDNARVVLVTDPESGEWTLARALSKRSAGSERPSGEPSLYGFSAIELGQVEVVADHPSFGHIEARVHHVQGSALLGGPDSSISIERFGVRLVQNHDLALTGTGSFRLLRKGSMAGTFHGFVDGTELDASAQTEGDVLGLRLDIPSALPENVRRRLREWPVQVPVAVQLTARGPLHALELTALLQASESRLELTGVADLGAPVQAHLAVQGHALDARLFLPAAPSTRLEMRADLQLTQQATGLLGAIEVDTEPTRVASIDLPATHLSLRVEGGQTKGQLQLSAARGDVEVRLVHTPGGSIDLTAHASRLELRAWPELEGRLSGRVELEAQARISDQHFEGKLGVEITDLAGAKLSLKQGHAQGRFKGQLDALDKTDLDTSLDAHGLQLGPLVFGTARVTSRGTWRSSRVSADLFSPAGQKSSVQGRLSLEQELRFDDLKLSIVQRDLALTAFVRTFSPTRDLLLVDSLHVSGRAGVLNGRARIQAGEVDVNLDAEALDSAVLARSLGIDTERLQGLLSGHAELLTGRGAPLAKLDVKIERLSVRGVSLGSVNVQAQLHERHLETTLESLESPLGHAKANLTAELGGTPLTIQSWERATFQGAVSLGDLPLWPVGLLLAQWGRLKDLDGHLDATLQIRRSDPATLPSLFLQAGTKELTFSVVPAPGAAQSATDYKGYALHATASVDGESGHGAATVLLTDEHGELVTTSGSLELDLPGILREPRSILRELLQAPLDAMLHLHPRQLSLLPPPFGIRGLTGSVEATLRLKGNLREPTFSVTASGRQLLGGYAADGRAVDVDGSAEYTPSTRRISGNAEVAHSGTSLVSARLEGTLDNPLFSKFDWATTELHAAAMLNGVPLELWPAAARQQLMARLYGSLAFERHGAEQEQRAELELGELSVSGHSLGNGHLSFANRASGTSAELLIGGGEHYLRAKLAGGSPAATGGESSLQGSMLARGFAAASLSPFVSGVLTHLDGDVDADLDFTLRPKSVSDTYLGINGKGQLKNGSARLDALGIDVRELSATLTARSTPDYTVIQIDPVEAKSRSRTPNFRGDAELWLKGVRLVNGEANLSLNEVPLSLKGALRGSLRGQVKGRLERREDHLFVEVKLPTLRVKLPATSGRNLIALEPNPDLNILQVVEDSVPLPADALLWKIDFQLGNAVRIQRADLDVPLTGEPHLEYRNELRPSGSIEALPGGRITLFDQNFTIERGIVEFMPEEPDNPRVDLTASWRAADGTNVYVDVTGRAKQANIATRDDRGLEDVERLYLITGNTNDVSSADLGDGSASEGTAIGQTVALGINQLLRESLGNVAVSVGTTSDDRASYGASVRLSDKLSFQGNFQPASESRLGEATNDLTGTLDYRFNRRWSLRTELGTSGGAFDLLWSHRY
jgi:translocation-and-assembly-module (TAM) inner membrane subunit TamB-like protein